MNSFVNVFVIFIASLYHFIINMHLILPLPSFPDQTYDIWTATGVSAYCGGLWVTACEAMANLAARLGDRIHAEYYSSLAAKAREVSIPLQD
jgi:uncharacterized protein (DUF608 family)